MSSVGKDYDRIVSKIKKLEDTIKKDFETSQEKPETYIYKRAVTSLEFNTTCLERADQALQKRKDYLRQKYEEDLLKAEQDNEKDVLKYTKGIESANMIMEEEKKKKKSKTVIHAEYDIAQLQQQLNKLNLPRYGDHVMSEDLPKKVVKMTVAESESESESESVSKSIPSCPCGGKCPTMKVGIEDHPTCLISSMDMESMKRAKQEAKEIARELAQKERIKEEKREYDKIIYMQDVERKLAAEKARLDHNRREELEEAKQEKQREEEERRLEEEEWQEAQKYIAEKKAQQAAEKPIKQTPFTPYNQLPVPDVKKKPIKKVGVGSILYRPPVEVS
jgi:hypothetical protein